MRLAAITLILALPACGGADDVAERVEERADDRADAMERAGASKGNAAQANIVAEQADQIRQAGEERAEAIRESDLDAGALSDAEKKALVEADGTTNTVKR